MICQLIPLIWRLALKTLAERFALHVAWRRQASDIQHCSCEIDILHDIFDNSAWRYFSRIASEERHLKGVFVDEALVEPAVVAEEHSLVLKKIRALVVDRSADV